jgi:hypothetical protein
LFCPCGVLFIPNHSISSIAGHREEEAEDEEAEEDEEEADEEEDEKEAEEA